MRSPYSAALLSFVLPGMGQLYNGEHAKGIALLCIDLGIAFGMIMATIGPASFRSLLTVIMLVIAYIFVWIPAIIDAFQHAAGKPEPLLSGGKIWYVLVMLLAVGPMALPLLWQSARFSKNAKIIWTIFVILIAILSILFLVFVGPSVERLLRNPPMLPDL